MKNSIFVVLFLGFFLSCINSDSQEQEPIGVPSEYFPTHIGSRWEYEVTLGEESPMGYKEVFWPLGNNKDICYGTTEFFGQEGNEGKKYPLTLKVTETASTQGPLKWPNGVRVEIVEDSLNLFRAAKELYWCYTGGGSTGQQFMAQRVVVHSSFNSPIHDLWGRKDGFSITVLFFADKPGMSIGIGENPREVLIYLGVEDGLLKFERRVENENDALLFKEHRYFKRHVGLVNLIQYVDGKVSMEWNLKK